MAAATRAKPTDAIEAYSDPDDNLFLECSLNAPAAMAAYLVTGNFKHFPRLGLDPAKSITCLGGLVGLGQVETDSCSGGDPSAAECARGLRRSARRAGGRRELPVRRRG